jgi:peptidoglycan/xylan/chitin deacetylase (PgdA/CDA1 family)
VFLGGVAGFAGAAALMAPSALAHAHRPGAAEAEITSLIALGYPLYCGGLRRRVVALTFDDGPGPLTSLALRILRRAHARATFFLVGRNLAEWPWLPKREVALGGVGDHTWTHRWLPALGRVAIAAELERTKVAIERLTRARVDFFRPPYGAHNRAVDAEARTLGMLEVLWSVDSRDSEGADTAQIGANFARGLRPGSIVLLHENRGQTTAAIRFEILPALRRRGYRTVSLRELLATDPPTLPQLRAGLAGCLRVGAAPSRRSR